MFKCRACGNRHEIMDWPKRFLRFPNPWIYRVTGSSTAMPFPRSSAVAGEFIDHVKMVHIYRENPRERAMEHLLACGGWSAKLYSLPGKNDNAIYPSVGVLWTFRDERAAEQYCQKLREGYPLWWGTRLIGYGIALGIGATIFSVLEYLIEKCP